MEVCNIFEMINIPIPAQRYKTHLGSIEKYRKHFPTTPYDFVSREAYLAWIPAFAGMTNGRFKEVFHPLVRSSLDG